MNIDSAREKFLLFLQNYEEYKTCDFSESDTRSKVIDKLLEFFNKFFSISNDRF